MATELEKRLIKPVMDADVSVVAAILEEENVSTLSISHEIVAIGANIELLELLVAHGYNINKPGSTMPSQQCRTLIDYKEALKKDDVVHWLVEHGAKLDRGQEDYLIFPCPPPLLDTAAQWASVSTFQYLRTNGAKLGRRTLHLAVQMAASRKSDLEAPPDWKGFNTNIKGGDIRKRMREMLPYLVDELNLDVNAVDFTWDQKDHPPPPGHYGRPLNYAASEMGTKVTEWLMKKGADPHLGSDMGLDIWITAKLNNYESLWKVLDDWEKGHE